MVVSDASLGSVKRNGSDQGEPITTVYSQGCYFALLGDAKLVAGCQVISTYLIAGHTEFPESAESHTQPKPWQQKKLLTLANCVKALWQQSSVLTCWVEKRRPQ